ncbi:unnamed protein product [Tuber melanosporum]|uniref:(Perigord truffle) hypothetical protein n=1 Tax=Tuber melanosporum (strain Mel28) TaxID=656061 RepID=D5GG37_TUBMM|nr:uncharacterized protein GSTUM_00001977001 [Tuber melanosporum]CAZ83480.1 unnamed protein product [Tuber melanosporum]
MRSHQCPQVPASLPAFSGEFNDPWVVCSPDMPEPRRSSYPRMSSCSIGPSIHRGTREASICATTSVGKNTAPLSLPVPQARANSSSRPGITPAMCPKIRNSINCPISPMCGENTLWWGCSGYSANPSGLSSQRSFLGVR